MSELVIIFNQLSQANFSIRMFGGIFDSKKNESSLQNSIDN